MIRVLSVFGTRPEAIKMAPVIEEMARHPTRIFSRVCVTGQHRSMLDQVLKLFRLKPDYDLRVMQAGQTPSQVGARVLLRLQAVLKAEPWDWVLVQGDTTSAMAAALAGFYAGVKVAHIEAGLRTFDKLQPFPEEMNRRLITAIADRHFAPTEQARRNLLQEHVHPAHIAVTGNPVIDSLRAVARLSYNPDGGPLGDVPWNRRILVVTVHRRENFAQPLEDICLAIRELVGLYPQDVHMVWSVHPNPAVARTVYRLLRGVQGLTLVPPLDYLALVYLMKRCYLVLTDSGGLQEEVPSLGKPVLVLRNVTERPEAVQAGTVRLIGPHRKRIVQHTIELLENPTAYMQMARAINPYGDGRASQRIVGSLLSEPVSPFEPAPNPAL